MTDFSIYRERSAHGFRAEPLDLVTNLAFVIAAAWLARRLATRRRAYPPPWEAWVLTALIGSIGLGRGLWHLTARPWWLLVREHSRTLGRPLHDQFRGMFGVEEVANGRHGYPNPFGLRGIGLERLALVAAQRFPEGGFVEHPDPAQAMGHVFLPSMLAYPCILPVLQPPE